MKYIGCSVFWSEIGLKPGEIRAWAIAGCAACQSMGFAIKWRAASAIKARAGGLFGFVY
jgi:hypothetical protein